ncbi:MAG: DUF4397 domain-containing protein, partial [Saprospiraceae bacterium]|nr:DUF4397 domain-containing protein [Saprospiraceae bacterium]
MHRSGTRGAFCFWWPNICSPLSQPVFNSSKFDFCLTILNHIQNIIKQNLFRRALFNQVLQSTFAFMKTFTTSFLLLFLFAAGLFGQTARVQVIHNSPSGTVDVWANDNLLLDNFTFRSATPFIDVPAGVDIVLGIAPESSTSAASSLATFPVNLESGKTYIVTA